MATGILISGVGLGGLLVPVVTWLIYTFEWRNAMVVVGLGMIVIVLPLSLLIRHRPEPYGYRPDGDTGNLSEAEQVRIAAESAETSVSAKQAFGHRAFWNVGFASLIFMMVSSALVTHIMPYFTSLGIDRSISAMVVCPEYVD